MRVTPGDVFIPGGLPEATYVSREHLRIEGSLNDWLCTRQKPLLSVSGPTKSGKTVLLKKSIQNGIWLSGGAIDTAEDFWEAICEELEVFTDHAISGSYSRVANGQATLGGDPLGSVSAGAERDMTREIARARSGTARSAARKALKQNRDKIVVIDDFHYINSNEQVSIVHGLKDLIFDGLGVVVAAVPHRAYDVVRVEKEMTGRVETLSVEDWDSNDLRLIGLQGFEALGVEISEAILDRLVAESFTSPHLMQTHCLQLCRANSTDGGLNPSLQAPDWKRFFERQASATSKTAFDLLKTGPRTRTDRAIRHLKDGTNTDIYGLVLAAIEKTGPKTSVTYDEIRASLRDILESELPQRHEITNVLGQMTKIAKESIEGEPVLDYDEEYSTLHLVDPYFAYYLRWASPAMKDIAVHRPSDELS